MKGMRMKRPSPSLVISVLALFVALGGTGYAALKLPKNSVKAKQIATGAVGTSEVKNRSLKLGDISNSARNALRGQTGPAGAQGLTGPKGDTGPAGPTITGSARSTNNETTLPGDGIVADLAGSNGTTGTGVLTLTTQSRVYITGSADLANQSAAAPVRVRCTPKISDAGGTTLPNDAGPNQFFDIHQQLAEAGSPQVHAVVPVTGSILVAPGTYNAGIVCAQIGMTGTASRFQAAVNVIAVPATS